MIDQRMGAVIVLLFIFTTMVAIVILTWSDQDQGGILQREAQFDLNMSQIDAQTGHERAFLMAIEAGATTDAEWQATKPTKRRPQ